MITGDNDVRLISLETDAGVALSYANKAAFQGDGWDLTWYDVDAVALTSQPVWTIADQGDGVHLVNYEVPPGIFWVGFTRPAAKRNDPAGWRDEGLSNDEDSLAGIMSAQGGLPSIVKADDVDLGDAVNGDSWNPGTLYIPLGRLTRFGYSYADLASGWTIAGAFKETSTGTTIVSGVTTVFGATVASDGAFNISYLTTPTAMALTTETERTFYLDIQLTRTSGAKIITTNRYRLRMKWKRT